MKTLLFRPIPLLVSLPPFLLFHTQACTQYHPSSPPPPPPPFLAVSITYGTAFVYIYACPLLRVSQFFSSCSLLTCILHFRLCFHPLLVPYIDLCWEVSIHTHTLTHLSLSPLDASSVCLPAHLPLASDASLCHLSFSRGMFCRKS